MATFTIDSENGITGYALGKAVPDGNTKRFATESELAQLAAEPLAGGDTLIFIPFVDSRWAHLGSLHPVPAFGDSR